MRNRKTSLRSLRGQLDERARRERDILSEYVIRPVHNGLWLVHGAFSTQPRVVASGRGGRSFRPGCAVLTGMQGTANERRSIISDPPPGFLGTASFTFPSALGVARDTYGIVRADPSTLEAGVVAEVVTLYGFGFRETPVDTFRAVVFNTITGAWDSDPLVTIGAATWIPTNGGTRVTVPITVDFTAPEGYSIAIEVTRS